MKRSLTLMAGTALLSLAACSGNQENAEDSGSAPNEAEARVEGGAPPEGAELGNGMNAMDANMMSAGPAMNADGNDLAAPAPANSAE